MMRIALAALLSFSFISLSAQASEVNISGSTSVARIMDVLAEEFNATHKETYIAVQGIGSTAGITLLKKGVADLGMSSRNLTESEQDENIKVSTLALDGLAVVVNGANPLTNITREQLYDVYKGKITNWKQLGGHDQKIAVVTREASSGTQYSFESLLGLTKVVNNRQVSDVNPDNLVVNSNSMVKTLVNHNKQAIGFISMGSIDRSVKAISFEGVQPSNKNVADRSYKLARPFLVIYRSDKLDDDSKAFLEFLKSDSAKKLIQEYGYTAEK